MSHSSWEKWSSPGRMDFPPPGGLGGFGVGLWLLAMAEEARAEHGEEMRHSLQSRRWEMVLHQQILQTPLQ